MAELSLASAPILQRSTITTIDTCKFRRAALSVRGAPIASPSATFVFPDDGYDVVVTDANFKAYRHLFGDCLAHPRGCDCERVQRPSMGQKEAFEQLALRFKAVHHPLTIAFHQRPVLLAPISTGADAPLERNRSDPLPHAANAPLVEDLREREHLHAVLDAVPERVLPLHPVLSNAVERRMRANALHIKERQERERRGAKSIEKIFLRNPARSTGPAVHELLTRVNAKRTLQAVGPDNRTGAASRHGGAGDVPPTSPTRLSSLSKRTGGVRNSART